MITVEEAAEIIRRFVPDWSKHPFTQDLVSDRNYPPFHRVMMDGIAVNFEAHQKGLRSFAVQGICPAGEPAGELSTSEACLEVMTGAPLPRGADLVIPYEHVNVEAGVAMVTVDVSRERFENVHFEGSDCKQGDRVLHRGETFNGPHAGIAASMGYATLPLVPLPRIMIVSTGDELVEVDQAPLPHQIRRSNAHALRASLNLCGLVDVSLAHLPDDPLAVAAHYEKHAPEFDLLIYSGGVSKGKFDYLPNVWTELGVTRRFHEVSQRPGKPLWFGTDEVRKTVVLGLPGNPVSSLVCLHRYLLPGRKIFARLAEEIVFKKDLTSFVPAKLHFGTDGTLTAVPLRIKNSGEFTALAGSDGFVELPRAQTVFRAGEAFAFYPWRPF